MTLPLQDPLLSAEGQGQPSHRTGFFRTVLRERKSAVIGLSIIASRPSLVLFLLFFGYALSGYVMWAMGHRVRPVLPEE